MDDFPARLADLLENVATKVRSLTVDRAEKAVKIASLSLPAAVLGAIAVVFLFMTIFRALAIPLGDAAAYAIIAGLFLVAAVFTWGKRRRASEDET